MSLNGSKRIKLFAIINLIFVVEHGYGAKCVSAVILSIHQKANASRA